MSKYLAKIKFKMKKTHPDIGCIQGEWTPDRIFEFDDVYEFQEGWYEPDYEKQYMKHDLALVAGGGYNADHIADVKYEIKKITKKEAQEWREARERRMQEARTLTES